MSDSKIYYATDEEADEMDELVSKMVHSVSGKNGSLTAVAALRIATGLWKLGGADRFSVEAVIAQHLDAVYGEPSKPN